MDHEKDGFDLDDLLDDLLDDGLAAITVTLGVFVGLCVILAGRGRETVFSACCFVASLAGLQLLMKRLSSPPYSFRFPGMVTALHFTIMWLISVAYWTAKGEPHKCRPLSVGSSRRFATVVLPISLSNPLAAAFNNKALVHVGAGLCAVIGTLSPVAVALLSRACGRAMSLLSWLGVLVAFSGGAIITNAEVHGVSVGSSSAAVLGIGFALSSVALRACRIVLMDSLIAPSAYRSAEASRPEASLSPMHMFAVQAPWSALVAVTFAMCTESPGEAWEDLTAPVVGMICLTCFGAISVCLLGIFNLRDLGASMQQMIGKLNTICTMALSIGLLGESLPAQAMAGSFVVLVGVALFERGNRVHESGRVKVKQDSLEELD